MPRNITEVRLLSVPLKKDLADTPCFVTREQQTNYFFSKTVKAGFDFSYQKKDQIIRYPADYDELLNCNYVMYKNNAYGSKWFYAFIINKEFVSDGRTDITIKTDPIQTWHFDYIVKPSFVEREHVSDDTTGLHTFPEQLETGDYIINKRNANESLLLTSLIMGATVDLNNGYKNVAGTKYNGIFSGIKYYMLTHSDANKVITDLANEGKSDAIVSIFTCPSRFVSTTVPENGKYAEVDAGEDVISTEWVSTFGIDEEENFKPTDINGYKPRNNKLFTYPYCYMLMSNNAGGSAVYKYELFKNPSDDTICPFRIYSAITPGFSIRIVPRYYNGTTNNNDEGLNLGKFPVCSWNTDVYTNWLTQNAVNIPLSIGSALVNTGVGVAGALMTPATGGMSAIATAGALTSGITSITGVLGEKYQHSLQPPQAEGNLNSGDVSFSAGYLTFTAHQMTIKKEFAEIIDGYFDMFGYQVNKVKVPSKLHREEYWYTKTRDVNIDGAIPPEDLEEIRNAYNRGIRFWRNPQNIGAFTLSNKPV